MLNPKYFLLAPALLGFACAACTSEEDDIFDQAAAVRMDAAKTDTKALLVSADAGWELCYFADNTWEEGHVILMKFHADESVEMASSNPWVANAFGSTDRYAVQRETSLYTMISDDGPVLTFNTFNRNLHIYSEPYNLPSAAYNPNNVPFPYGPTNANGRDESEAGYGHNGDYEFVVLNSTDSEITLRGKKTRITMRMRRLADGTDWDQYFAEVNRRSQSTFSTYFGDLTMTVNGHSLRLANLTTGVMQVVADDDDPIIEVVKMPFLYTTDGIRLREPYTGYEERLADIAFQDLAYAADGTFTVADREVSFALSKSLAQIFCTNSFTWKIDLASATGEVASLISAMRSEAAANSRFKDIAYLQFEYNATGKKNVLKIKTTGQSSTGSLYGTPTALESGDAVTLAYSTTDGDTYGKGFVRTIPSFGSLVELLSAHTWNISTDKPFGPDVLTLTNADNPADSFTVAL